MFYKSNILNVLLLSSIALISKYIYIYINATQLFIFQTNAVLWSFIFFLYFILFIS